MSAADKILTEPRLLEIVSGHRHAGRRIVFTNGAFDLLHVGHVRALEEAATLGGVLVVGINSDRSVRAGKGAGRPVVPVRSEKRNRSASTSPPSAAWSSIHSPSPDAG